MQVVIEKNRKTSATSITFTGVEKPAKLPPQAQYVYYAIAQLESATVEQIAERCIELGMQTRQAPERIVAYYLPTLRDAGVIEK